MSTTTYQSTLPHATRHYSFDVSGMTEEEFWAKIHESDDDVKNGKYYTLDELDEVLGIRSKGRKVCVATRL